MFSWTQILYNKTKKNVILSYIRYKKHYTKKTKALPLQEKYYCYLLKPKADHQRSKKMLRGFSWIGPHVREKVPPKIDLVRKIYTNETQIIHFIILRQLAIDTTLEDIYIDEEKRPDDEIVIPKVDLWSITVEAESNPFDLDYTKR